MGAEPPAAAGPRTMRRGLVAPVLGVIVLSAAPAAADDLSGIFRWFLQETRRQGERSDAVGSTLDLRYQRNITPLFSYYLGARYVGSIEEPPAGSLVEQLGDQSNNQFEPRIELRWHPRYYDLSVGHRYVRFRDRDEGFPPALRQERNTFGRFRTQFAHRPELLLEYDSREVAPDQGNETLNSRFLTQVSFSAEGLTASAGRRHSVQEVRTVSRRTTNEDLFAASLSRVLADGQVLVFANFNLTDLASREDLNQETVVPVPRTLRRGLLALDTTPLDGELDREPDLVDGNRSTPTRANIGGGIAGGQIDWNLGVELALREFVDVIDVWLADPIPADNAARYRWEVYSSEDNLTWSLVSGAPGRVYDRFEGRFRLTFPRVTAQYVKVVNTTVDDTLGAVFVSEIEAFGQELRGVTTRTGTRTENTSATVTWSPAETFSATVGGFRNAIRTGSSGQETGSRDDRGNLTLSFRPSPVFVSSISYLNATRDRTLIPTEKEDSYSLNMTALPVEDLDLSLAMNVRERTRDGETVETGTYLFRVATLLYRDLSLSVGYGESHDENFDVATRDRETYTASLDTRPREELEFNTDVVHERLETPSSPPGEQILRNTNWNNRLVIRPSGALNLALQGTYFRLGEDNGWSRALQADWLPFRGGALQVSLDFREDDPRQGQLRRTRSGSVRWNLNRRMFLEFEALRQKAESPDVPLQAQTLLTLFFQARL